MAERAIRAALVGATGRMGRAIASHADGSALRIVAAIASPQSASLGRDLGELTGRSARGLKVTGDLEPLLTGCDVVLDFSQPEALERHLLACQRARKPLLVGTTGYPNTFERTLDAAARDIALLVAPNTSLAVAAMLDLVARAALTLPPDFEVEIREAHHRGKRDAPSGTALALGDAVARARGSTLEQRRAPPRESGRARKEGEIGFASIRAGDLVGEHEVRFVGEGEELTLLHRATDRRIFARGAITAALWLAGQPPGRYRMRDLIAAKSAS